MRLFHLVSEFLPTGDQPRLIGYLARGGMDNETYQVLLGFAEPGKTLQRGFLTFVIFGDGAAAEGSVHEAMNLAGVWKLPVLFVCENNCWSSVQRPWDISIRS